MQQKIIKPQDLICMNNYADEYHYHIDLSYASCDNLLFGELIYRKNAQLWLYRNLAEIVFQAAKICFEKHDLRFVLYDGLRTINAQEAMIKTQRVIDNPHWLEEPRLLSPAGYGGHPRGMAIDIGLENTKGILLDMGCVFDHLDKEAHRDYKHSQEIMDNRKILDDCMISAAQALNIPILPLPEEWWDFRLPADFYNQYAPLSDADLPEHMRLVNI